MLMTPPSAARTPPHAKRLLDSHIASEALSARVIAGGEGGDPRLRGEGEVGCDACNRQISFGRSTTSPSHCFAMGPTLSPAARRRGSLSEMCECDRRKAWGRKWDACGGQGCRFSLREYRQGYATTLLSSVKSQASSPGRIILAYRQGGREASVAHHEWGPRRGDDSRMLSSQFSLVPGITNQH